MTARWRVSEASYIYKKNVNFVKNEIFESVNYVKNAIFKMRILWIIEILKMWIFQKMRI